jgi:hypothetical protein
MKKNLFSLLLILMVLSMSLPSAQAQCAMCTINAEQGVKNGNTQSKGLNSGVLYLLALPYLGIVGVGALWYFKYRKKATIHMKNA